MSDKVVIEGSLVDVRNVHQHKCARLIIDVPAEYAAHVIDVFGWPTMVSPVAVAVARLNVQPKENDRATQTAETGLTGTSPRPRGPQPSRAGGERKDWDSMSYAQQAGILCDDPSFHIFLKSHLSVDGIPNEKQAADFVREICQVSSRAEILPGTPAENRWRLLVSSYRAWQQEPAVVPA